MTQSAQAEAVRASLDAHLADDRPQRTVKFDAPCACGHLVEWQSVAWVRNTTTCTKPRCVCAGVGIDEGTAR